MDIPFTTDQFFEVIEKYNLAFFPVQIFILLLSVLCVILLHSNPSIKNKIIGGFLGFLWLWAGIAYHLVFFTDINQAAYAFSGIFILQGILFLYETFIGKNLEFSFSGRPMDYVAYAFIILGILIYPLLIYLLENSIQSTITLGLPCPSTIFTFGFLMLTSMKFPKYLLIIPAIWTIIGTSAAFNFGVYPDYLMPVAALIAIVYLVRR